MLPDPETVANSLASAAKAADPVDPNRLNESEPEELRSFLQRWKFGGYGWTSPMNLIITAAWLKWLDPDQDVCKIWARNDSGVIPGGYSIRSLDEKYTVPVVEHLGIAPGFCSPNSGMQGSRALEKSREAVRLDARFKIAQRVRFDLDLFIDVMNAINLLSAERARIAFQTLIGVGKWIRQQRASLQVTEVRSGDTESGCIATLTSLAETAADPQLVTLITAGVVQTMLGRPGSQSSFEIRGSDSAMTSANARSGAIGDFEIWSEDQCTLAVEVKGASIQFGVGDVRRALRRGEGKTSLYLLVTAAAQPWDAAAGGERMCQDVIMEAAGRGLHVAAMTVRDLVVLCLAVPGVVSEKIYESINEQIEGSSSLRTDAIEQWRQAQASIPSRD